MAGDAPKQFMVLGDRPVLAWSAGAMAAADGIEEMVVGAAQEEMERTSAVIMEWIRNVPVKLAVGGHERQETVRKCLDLVSPGIEIVVIHDAARPFASPALAKAVMEAAKRSGAATSAIRPSDTIKQVDEKGGKNLDRDKLWMVQTPQAFALDLIREAHAKAHAQGHVATDDTALVEWMGRPVEMVEGDRLNVKLTTAEDWDMARALAAACIEAPSRAGR